MGQNQETYSRLDQSLKARMEAFRSPAMVLALTDRDRLVHLSALGYADLERKTPVTPSHLFAIGSIGKSFTGIAMLQASEAGLLDLRAPVKTYLPWFEVKSRFQPFNLHHLLTHSSGLPRGTDFSPDPRSELYAARELETGFAPGSHYFYSDLGYKLLGLVLEAATGRPYAEIVREKILEPLEMHCTHAVTTHEQRPRMAVGYRDLYDDRPGHASHPLVPADWVETNSADGCIVSTAEDMSRFARMLLNEGEGPHGPIISPLSYRKMVFPMIEDEGEAYSYGLYLFDDDGYRYAGHGGDVPGYESYMWLDMDNGLGTIMLTTTPYAPRTSFIALEYFREVYLGESTPDLPPLPNFTHVGNAAEYAGVYRSGTCQLILEAIHHHLFLCCGEQRVLLEERGTDQFYADHPDWNRYLLVFGRSEKGEVVEASYGPQWFVNDRFQGPDTFEVPEAWAAYAGHYRAHDPWLTNFRVYARKGQLILSSPNGEEEFLFPIEEGRFRIGEEEYIPDQLVFDHVADGQALRASRSGCSYYRFFTP